MTSPAVTINVDSSLHDAIGKMLHEQVGCLIVVDAGVTGILTRTDVLEVAYQAGESLDNLPVSIAMTDDVVTTAPNQSVGLALNDMKANNIKKLPVVNDFELVGIITLTDIALQQPERYREVQRTINQKEDWTH